MYIARRTVSWKICITNNIIMLYYMCALHGESALLTTLCCIMCTAGRARLRKICIANNIVWYYMCALHGEHGCGKSALLTTLTQSCALHGEVVDGLYLGLLTALYYLCIARRTGSYYALLTTLHLYTCELHREKVRGKFASLTTLYCITCGLPGEPAHRKFALLTTLHCT